MSEIHMAQRRRIGIIIPNPGLKVENANTHDSYSTIMLPGNPQPSFCPADSFYLTKKLYVKDNEIRWEVTHCKRTLKSSKCYSSRFPNETKYKQLQDTFNG